MSYRGIGWGYGCGVQGLGVDPLGCGPGEEFDWTSMQCVTAGQAITPSPPVPTQVPPLPPIPSMPPQSAPPVAAPPARSALEPWIPALVVGGIVFGAVLLLK
jgi:hypothetical protein